MVQRRCVRYGFWCGLSLLAACASAPNVRRMPPEFTDEGLRAQMRVLASDRFEGRRPGTVGANETVDYLVAKLRRLGLKPGNGASFLQQVPIVEIGAGDDASLSVSGQGQTRSLAYRQDMVVWTARERAQSSIRHSPMVFVGYGIDAPEYGWNDYRGIDVRGKTVVALISDPGAASKDSKLFGGRSMTAYGLPEYKLREAARHGAAGILLIHEQSLDGRAWAAIVNAYAGARLEAPSAAAHAGRAAIEGWISHAVARGLFAQAGLDFHALAARAAEPEFRAVPLGLYADAQVHNTIRRFDSPNVIALLPGRKRRREYVVYTAHWDGLGHAAGQTSGPVLDGAVDNASGLAGLLLLAQDFARGKPAPDRSIVFMAPTATLYARLGSRYYVDHPVYPLRDTVADINLDQLNIGGPTRDVSVIGYGQSELERDLARLAGLQGRVVRPEPFPRWGEFFRSDDFSFAEAGVPALYAVGGIDDAAMGSQFGKARLRAYIERRRGQAGDRYFPSVSVRGTLDDLHLYHDLGMRLAQARRFPNWNPDSKYRTARGQSRSDSID